MKVIFLLSFCLLLHLAVSQISLCKKENEKCELNPFKRCCPGFFCVKQQDSVLRCSGSIVIATNQCRNWGEWCVHAPCCTELNLVCRKLGGDIQTMTCQYPNATRETASTCKHKGDLCGPTPGYCCTGLTCRKKFPRKCQ